MEAQQIRELYGYNLGVIDLRKEVIRLNNIIYSCKTNNSLIGVVGYKLRSPEYIT